MWTPNTTDAQGRRYSYGNQPGIAQWNLARLAEALLPIVERSELEAGLNAFADTFNEGWRDALAKKLGLIGLTPEDEELTSGVLEALAESETDFTIFFRRLADVPANGDLLAPLQGAFYDEQASQRAAAGLAAPLRPA